MFSPLESLRTIHIPLLPNSGLGQLLRAQMPTGCSALGVEAEFCQAAICCLSDPSMVHLLFAPSSLGKSRPLLPTCPFSTWLLPSCASCHSAKTQLLRSTQHCNLLHLSPAQWHLVAAQQLLPSAHSRSFALVHAENLTFH
jgi:hypothetical protein